MGNGRYVDRGLRLLANPRIPEQFMDALYIIIPPISHGTSSPSSLIPYFYPSNFISPTTLYLLLSAIFKMQFLTPLVVTAILATSVSAHPGHDVSHEIEARATFMKTSKRDLSHCAAKIKARGLDYSSVQRRAAVAKAARQKRNLATNVPYLKARDEATVLNTTHLSSEAYTNATDESIIFSGNSSCILSPEVTQGPYCKARLCKGSEPMN